ncbi:MAG TPA: M23 family metallopeptidase [Drouetiella sp.]
MFSEKRAFFGLTETQEYPVTNKSKVFEAWLPYSEGNVARCIQGPMSGTTHQNCYAWDFVLPPKSLIISAYPGQVCYIFDDSKHSGAHSPEHSNLIIVDCGANRFATYAHHLTGTALVKLGDMVYAGTPLAEIGNSGTTSPHLHFDVRGANWQTSHDVRFHGAENGSIQVKDGTNYLSRTKEILLNPPEVFVNSMLSGDEFLANGVRTLAQQNPSYLFEAGSKCVYRGSLLTRSENVFFQLWGYGIKGAVLATHARTDRGGEFVLEISIPSKLKGSFWYMLSSRCRSGTSIVPVGIK